uniref:Peptidoglycan binding-like domain-containing protein n=1 Tax=Tolypothrix bouteillei VB521301 TaxID=1479485 RepID=A0A0C1NFJ5_9CYAN
MQQKQRSKSTWGIELLLCLSAPLLFGFSPTVSFAAPTQTIAQASPRVGVNRPNLKVGSQGDPVSELQAALKLLGFYAGTVDGVYSESTAIAVSRFQEAAGLSPNGVVDTNTWQRLFPSDAIALTPASSNSDTFPTPSQTLRDNNSAVVVPSSEPRTAPIANRTGNLKPESRPTITPNRASNLKPEPRPAGTGVATSTSDRPSTRQTSSTRSNPSSTSRPANRSQQSTRAGSSARQTTRTQQTTSSESSKKTQQTASLQYTSDGLPILRPGMRGSEVTRLQRRLQRLGYLEESAIDGDFGPATEAAVVSLQKRYGLEADGIVGGGTWEILNRRRKQ